MSRNTDPSVTSATQLAQIKFRTLCEVYSTLGGTAYACTGDRFIYSGNTYSPVGGLGGIEKIVEDAEIFPRAVRLWFAAINSAQIADVLAESLYSKPVKLYRCVLSDSYTVTGTPQLAFVGYVNNINMKIGDEDRGNYFEIECESRLRQPTRARYFNKETLWNALGHSGDTFFNYVANIPGVQVNWGNSPLGSNYYSPWNNVNPSNPPPGPYPQNPNW